MKTIPTGWWPSAVSVTGVCLGLTLLVEVWVVTTTSGPSYSAFPVGVVTSVPFVVGLIYGGYWLAESELPPDRYDQVGRWWIAGVVVTVLLISVINTRVQPVSAFLVVGTVRWSAAIGGSVGLAIGVLQARAVLRGREAERIRQRRRQIERERDQLDEFASIVSHDLKNPLHTAKGHLELLREECDSPHIATIATAHDRMDTIVEDTLALARAGQEIGDTEPVELASVADTSWETIEASDSTLHVEGTRTIDTDRSSLQQLFDTLFRNAVEHAGPDATVRVGVLEDDAGFYVEDDGPGLPEPELGDVFESGYPTAAEKPGVGLRIVGTIVDAHGWEITATDSADGGARFEVTGVEPTV
jgi:signal transduction histidine kinase